MSYAPACVTTPFKKAILYADSLYALLATPIEFEVEVSIHSTDLYSVQIVGAGYSLATAAGFSRLIFDWEARIRFHLLPEENIPPGTYTPIFAANQLLVTKNTAVYALSDRPVEVGLMAVQL